MVTENQRIRELEKTEELSAYNQVCMAYDDLRDFVRALEKKGELKRIRFAVDPRLEITEFADRAVKQGGPALLFDRPKGSKIPALINAFAGERRTQIALL